MIDLLQRIVDQFVCWVMTALMTVLNAVIAGLAAAIVALSHLMPPMPDFPEVPEAVTTAMGWIAWFVPVHQMVIMLAFFITAWLLWFGVSVALKWAKAL